MGWLNIFGRLYRQKALTKTLQPTMKIPQALRSPTICANPKFGSSILLHQLVNTGTEICTNKYTNKHPLQLIFTAGMVQYENKTTTCSMKICPLAHTRKQIHQKYDVTSNSDSINVNF